MKYLYRLRAICTGIHTYFHFIGRPWTPGPDGRMIRHSHQQAMVLALIDWQICLHQEKYHD